MPHTNTRAPHPPEPPSTPDFLSGIFDQIGQREASLGQQLQGSNQLTADNLGNLLAASQGDQRTIVDKVSPFVTAIAAIADLTSGNKSRRASAGKKVSGITASRQAGIDRRRQEAQQKFKTQAGVEELTGRLRGQSLTAQQEQLGRQATRAGTVAGARQRGRQLDIAEKPPQARPLNPKEQREFDDITSADTTIESVFDDGRTLGQLTDRERFTIQKGYPSFDFRSDQERFVELRSTVIEEVSKEFKSALDEAIKLGDPEAEARIRGRMSLEVSKRLQGIRGSSGGRQPSPEDLFPAVDAADLGRELGIGFEPGEDIEDILNLAGREERRAGRDQTRGLFPSKEERRRQGQEIIDSILKLFSGSGDVKIPISRFGGRQGS